MWRLFKPHTPKNFTDKIFYTMRFRPFLRKASSPKPSPNSQFLDVSFFGIDNEII